MWNTAGAVSRRGYGGGAEDFLGVSDFMNCI